MFSELTSDRGAKSDVSQHPGPDNAVESKIRVLARRIRRARAQQLLSQEHLAYEAGVSVYTYAAIEKASIPAQPVPNPTLRTVICIMDVLGLD
jgi:DNA-binding XRE family transcriptional regulator